MNDYQLPPPTGDLQVRKVSLLKGVSHWSFNWCDGDEDHLIEVLLAMAADQQNELDWFDVAMIRQQMIHATTATTGDHP